MCLIERQNSPFVKITNSLFTKHQILPINSNTNHPKKRRKSHDLRRFFIILFCVRHYIFISAFAKNIIKSLY